MIYSDDDWNGIKPLIPPKYDKSKYNLIFDQHSHTNYSDGKLTIRQNVEWHIAMGYNALAITDHNNMKHSEQIDKIKTEYRNKEIVILSGIEWTTNRIHLNFLGVPYWKDKIKYKPTDDQIISAISKAHDLGGVVACNHIPWSVNEFHMKSHPSRDTLVEWGIDYFEIVNDDCKPENVYDQESYDLCLHHNGKVGMITGTDMHTPDGLMSGGVHGWTLMNVKIFSEETLLEELKSRRTEILYSKKPYLDPGIHKK